MTSDLAHTPARKLLAAWPLKLRLAGICLAVLMIGAWLAPPDTVTMAASQERAAPLLEEQVHREATPLFRGLQEVVGRLPHRGLAVRLPAIPGVIGSDFGLAASRPVFAVAIDGTRVLAHAAALEGARAVMVPLPDGRMVSASVVAYDPPTGVVLLQLPEPSAAAATIAATLQDVGALVVAAVSEAGADRMVPVFITSATPQRYGISAAAGLTPGMPIYSIGGELAAVANGDDTAWPLPALLGRLVGGDRPTSFGLVYQTIDESLRPAFGDAGVIVVRVVAGGPADVAGIREGDVIAAVGGTAMATAHEASPALVAQPSGVEVALTIRRGRRLLTIPAVPAEAYDVDALARETRSTTARGLSARAIFHDAALAAAGVPPNATVVRINGQAVTTAAQAGRAAGRTRAVVLLEYRGERSFAMIGPRP